MNKQKLYTTFSFFKTAAALSALCVLVLLLMEYLGHPGFLLPGLALISLGFIILSFRIVQLIYRLQLDRVHDTNQVESMQWIYQQFQPKVAFPPMRVIAGSPDFFKVIVEHCIELQPKVIVEAGSGVSSVVISEWLRSVGSDARHYALDHLEKYAKETEEKVVNSNSKILYAPLKNYNLSGSNWQWYDIEELANVDSIDLLIIDGPPEDIQKEARFPALPLLFEKLSDKAVIILDDTNRPDEQSIIKRWKATHQLKEKYLFTEKGTTVLYK
ncbi:MAG: class I SAM-dependent methyltransferase [Phaeodactylibacter sp.]|uniref:class I SAM-dependent methyltransferase n=1 Tax=Phaeodactylibacter sp. TaxID=1940289 RepID=UPI0032EF9B64